MIGVALPPGFSLELLQRKHQRHLFDCGQPEVNGWLRTRVFDDNYFSALATITIPFDEVQESSVFESVVVVGDPLWARFAASKR